MIGSCGTWEVWSTEAMARGRRSVLLRTLQLSITNFLWELPMGVTSIAEDVVGMMGPTPEGECNCLGAPLIVSSSDIVGRCLWNLQGKDDTSRSERNR